MSCPVADGVLDAKSCALATPHGSVSSMRTWRRVDIELGKPREERGRSLQRTSEKFGPEAATERQLLTSRGGGGWWGGSPRPRAGSKASHWPGLWRGG